MNSDNKPTSWTSKAGRQLAAKLDRFINPWPSHRKKWAAIILCLSIALSCIVVATSGWRQANLSIFKTDEIKKPRLQHKTVDSLQWNTEWDIIQKYNRITRFKQLVEQLTHQSMSQSLDSLLKSHPGLRDSLQEFMRFYE